MLPTSVVNNPTWRSAIHTAQSGENKCLHFGFFFRKTTQPFNISNIKGVLGLAETTRKFKSWTSTKFLALLLLNDKRYCFIEAWKNNKDDWDYGKAIYSRDLNKLLVELDPETIEILKLHLEKK